MTARLTTPSVTERSVLRKQVRGSTLLLAGRVCSLGLNLVTQVIIVRALSKAGYGALAYGISLIEMFSIITLLALDKTILRYGAIYHVQRDRPRLIGALGVASATPVVIGLMLVAAISCCGPGAQQLLGLDSPSGPLLLTLVWLIPANGVASVTQAIANVVYGARPLFWRKHLLSPLIKLGAVLVAAVTSSKPEHMALSLAIAGGLGLLVDGWLLARVLRDEQLWSVAWPTRWRLPVREFFRYSLPVLISDMAWLFRGALLVILLGWWSSPEATASMRAVLPVAKLNELVLFNFMVIFVPLASRLFATAQSSELWTTHRQTNLWIMAMSFPIFAGTVALAKPATLLLFGSAYADSAGVLILLACAFFVQTMYGMDGQLLRVLGRMRMLLAIDLAGGLLLGLTACLLIPHWGAIGAGVAAIVGIALHGELRRRAVAWTMGQKEARTQQVLILTAAAILAATSWWWEPGWVGGVAMSGVATLVVLRLMRRHLDFDGTLPELRKLPGSRWLLPERRPVISSTNLPAAVRRVAYVMSRFPKLTETFVLREMVELERSGMEVSVYPLQRERTKTIHSAARPFVERACFTPWLNFRILAANGNALVRNPADYLSTLGLLIGKNFGCPRYLSGAVLFFPKIVFLAQEMRHHGVQHVHAHFASHPAMAAWTIHRLTGIPYSFTAHGSDLHRDRHMLREKVADAATVITISEYNRQLILDECGRAFAEKVHVVHCGINPSEFTPRAELTCFERGTGPFQIICVGTLHEVKGQRYLLEACERLSQQGLDYRCRFVGNGPDERDLKRRASELGIADRVEFCGPQTTDEVRRLLSECDVIAAPSVPTADGRREGIPVVLMEGLGSRLAAVASRLSGVPELVRDGETGLLVEPRDSAGLAAALLRLCRDSELRTRLAAAGCRLVQEEFHVTRNSWKLRSILTGETIPAGVVRSEGEQDQQVLESSDRKGVVCPV